MDNKNLTFEGWFSSGLQCKMIEMANQIKVGGVYRSRARIPAQSVSSDVEREQGMI